MRGLSIKTLLMTPALLSPATALADGVFHPAGQSYACVNPRATRALANHADPRQNDPGWVHFVITDGRCFQVDPSEKWEQISQENGLLLLRRDPPRTGMPPLFFLPQQVSSGFPISPQPSAEAPTDGPVQLAPASPDPETPQASDKATDLLPKGWEKPRHDAEPAATEVSEDNSSPRKATPSFSSSNVSDSSPDTETGFGGLLIFTPLLIGAIGYFAFRERRRTARESRAWGIIDKEIRDQATALQIRRLQLVTTDAYGTIHLTKWAKEIGYFCNTRILSLLQIEGLTDQWPLLKARAEARIEEIAQRTPPGAVLNQKPLSDPRVFDPQMDPFDYERHCALLLEQAGWDARVTQASGDQGARTSSPPKAAGRSWFNASSIASRSETKPCRRSTPPSSTSRPMTLSWSQTQATPSQHGSSQPQRACICCTIRSWLRSASGWRLRTPDRHALRPTCKSCLRVATFMFFRVHILYPRIL